MTMHILTESILERHPELTELIHEEIRLMAIVQKLGKERRYVEYADARSRRASIRQQIAAVRHGA